MSNYMDWLNSDEAKKHRIDLLKMSGIPLELRLRKIFDEKGFIAVPYGYRDVGDNDDSRLLIEEGVWRELDTWAVSNKNQSIDINDLKINLLTQILCECKYSLDRDIVTFSDEYAGVYPQNFPILCNGHQLLGPNLSKDFNLPELAERIIEVSSTSDSMKDSNLTDRNIHEACEQLASALRYLVVNQRHNMRNTYNDLTRTSEIKRLWDIWVKEGKAKYQNTGYGSKVSEGSLNQFLSANYKKETVLKDCKNITIGLVYLMIIVDEYRGVIKAELDKNYNVIDFKDVGACLYSYSPQKPERYNAIIGSFPFLPIFVCNLTEVLRVLDIIETGSHKLLERMRTQLTQSPQLLPKELLFNEQINTI